jgi:hypothetical protein
MEDELFLPKICTDRLAKIKTLAVNLSLLVAGAFPLIVKV